MLKFLAGALMSLCFVLLARYAAGEEKAEPPSAPSITAQSFTIVDARGRKRAVLGMSKDLRSRVELVLYDTKGKAKFTLAQADDWGAGLWLYASGGGPFLQAVEYRDDAKGFSGGVVRVLGLEEGALKSASLTPHRLIIEEEGKAQVPIPAFPATDSDK